MKNYNFLRNWIKNGGGDHPFQYARKQKGVRMNKLFKDLDILPNNWYSNLRGTEAKKTKLEKYAEYFQLDTEELKVAQEVWLKENKAK